MVLVQDWNVNSGNEQLITVFKLNLLPLFIYLLHRTIYSLSRVFSFLL